MVRALSALWWRRFLARNACPWTELETFTALSGEQQRNDLSSRLLAQIRYFGNRSDALPEWKEAARIHDLTDLWRHWPDLPILTKTLLRERFPAHQIRDRFGIQGQIRSSGGSTGEPTQFLHDTSMLQTAVAGNIYTRLKMGWKPGMATIIVWGSERDIGRQTGNWQARTFSWLLQEYMVDGYQLSADTVERVMRVLRARRPVAIYGFTSMLEFVAGAVLNAGIQVPPGSVRTAWSGGEMLYPQQCRLFREAFGVPILNRYGGRELSTIACQFGAGGPLNVLRPWVFLEIVDESGKSATPGEPGRIVLTSTVCRGTPFLRFEIGDLGVYDETHYGASGIAAIRELQGRTAGLMKLPDGRTINNLYWNHLFKEFPEVRQFQVVYKRIGEIWISLVGTGMSEEREAEFRRMTSNLIAGTPLKLFWTDELARTGEGKLIQVMREEETLAN
jgi:phenylacetate-coenzyme A ligase PaaK-like adenylate-forming protein